MGGLREQESVKIRQALDAAGYSHMPATPENLKACFMDYVTAGYWSNLTVDDIEGISIGGMCQALKK